VRLILASGGSKPSILRKEKILELFNGVGREERALTPRRGGMADALALGIGRQG